MHVSMVVASATSGIQLSGVCMLRFPQHVFMCRALQASGFHLARHLSSTKSGPSLARTAQLCTPFLFVNIFLRRAAPLPTMTRRGLGDLSVTPLSLVFSETPHALQA